MSYKVLETIEWFKQFNNKELKIYGETKIFKIKLFYSNLPRLLGLQYFFKDKKSKFPSTRLMKYLYRNKISDEKIIKRVFYNFGNKTANNVYLRINNLKSFLENIENANIVNRTYKKSEINSNYLIIETKNDNNEKLQLGINIDESDGNSGKGYFETFFIRNDNLYFKNTKVYEKILKLTEVLKDGEEISFSFNDEVREKLLDEYLEKSFYNLIEVDREVRDLNGILKDTNIQINKEKQEKLIIKKDITL